MAAFALLSWPFLALILFSALGPSKGLIWSVLIGYLFLPENYGFDLQGLPSYNKNLALIVATIMGVALARLRGELPDKPPTRSFPRKVMIVLMVLFLATPVLTVATNGESLSYGPQVIQGLGLRDLISMWTDSLPFLVLFLVGQRLLAKPEDHRDILVALVVGALVYSFMVLFERRMSPQLNQWIYGYFQHSWVQHVRGGGFRPIVFLRHGLWVGWFMLSAVLAAFILLRHDKGNPQRMRFLLAGGWLLLVLLLSRNLGAVMLGVLFIPAILFLPRRLQMWISAVVAIVFLILPVTRQTDILPVDQVVSISARISDERAASLEYRLVNEGQFLQRALEKPLAGWGIWGRWRIWDPERGTDISTSDGKWVSTLGERGWLGYVGFFGLIIFPLLYLGRVHSREPVSIATLGFAVITAANLVYLIFNSAYNPMGWLMAGALSGFILAVHGKVDKSSEVDEMSQHAGEARYTRFSNRNVPSSQLRRS